jgi:hypothetical protein
VCLGISTGNVRKAIYVISSVNKDMLFWCSCFFLKLPQKRCILSCSYWVWSLFKKFKIVQNQHLEPLSRTIISCQLKWVFPS